MSHGLATGVWPGPGARGRAGPGPDLATPPGPRVKVHGSCLMAWLKAHGSVWGLALLMAQGSWLMSHGMATGVWPGPAARGRARPGPDLATRPLAPGPGWHPLAMSHEP